MIDPYSLAAFPIRIFHYEHSRSVATGFFYRHAGRLYLITNWHVLAGRNANDGSLMEGGVPTSIEIALLLRVTLGGSWLAWTWKTYPLLTDDGSATWLQHHYHRRAIDAAALSVEDPGSDYALFPINEVKETPDLYAGIGQECFVVGFPLGVFKNSCLPIWKRATIASEPDISIEGKRCFLVDTLTKEGMSGSPVVARSDHSYFSSPDGGRTATTMIGANGRRFLGVYSGRFGVNGADEARLGMVWSGLIIPQLIAHGIPGPHAADRE